MRMLLHSKRTARPVRLPQQLFLCALYASLLSTLLGTLFASALNTQQLEPTDVGMLQNVMKTLEPGVEARKKDGTANLMTWQELYAPFSQEQRALLDEFRKLRAETLGATSHFFGETVTGPELVPVGEQYVMKDDTKTLLDPQFLPRAALEAYQRMMDAMQADIGRRLLVESGYRSPAYQLYLFLYYLPKHHVSIIETNRFVALPGHSEHGYPPRQAIDFINEDGINGEDHPEQFEALPEYQWLRSRATEFHFALSYPRDNVYQTAFEPWHWHYEGS